MTKEEWYRMTHRLAGSVADVFKPIENMVIQDFIETANAEWEKVNPESGKEPT